MAETDDNEVLSRNDVLAPRPAPRLSSPVAVKITTVITNSVKEVSILVAVCVALFMGKISADQFLMVIVGMGMGHYARTKAEGAVGEQTLVEMTKR